MTRDVTLDIGMSPELLLRGSLLRSVPQAEAPSVGLESWRYGVSGGIDPA